MLLLLTALLAGVAAASSAGSGGSSNPQVESETPEPVVAPEQETQDEAQPTEAPKPPVTKAPETEEAVTEETKPEPVQEAVAEPQPAPVQEAVAEPQPAPAQEAVAEPQPAPAQEAVAEPRPAPAQEPVAEPQSAPAQEAVAEPQPAPAQEAVAEPQPAPAQETVAEPQPAPAQEPVAEPQPAPAQEAVAEPQPKLDVVAEPQLLKVEAPAPQPTPAEPPVADPILDRSVPQTDAEPTQAPSTTSTQSVDVMTGRVSVLDAPAKPVASVEILSQPEAGHVTVNADNSIAVVMSHTNKTGDMSFNYKVTHTDGSTEVVTTEMNVTPGEQSGGWGKGHAYMLATDEDNNVIVETGENHRDLFVSGSDKALSLEDIAAKEGMKVEEITGRWLANNGTYGATADMAVDETVGKRLWAEISRGENSNWLQFEKGYSYTWSRDLFARGGAGEDELHPMHITSYGEGERPVIENEVVSFSPDSKNVVITDVAFNSGMRLLSGDNFLLEDVTFQGTEGLVVQGVEGVTVRDSSFLDIARDKPANDSDIWEGHINRISGIYMAKSDGVLIENNYLDHIAWSNDYMANLSVEGGQPPSMFSHNIYLQYNMSDVTLRDNVSMRSGSFGAQVRSGGFIEDNVFLDNNAGLNFLGGQKVDGVASGNYTLATDNVVTSAGYRVVDQYSGTASRGLDNFAELSTLNDNIVAHLADPNNPDELSYKLVENTGLNSTNTHYDDTIVYNWVGANDIARGETTDQRVEGLNPAQLNATTIQNYAAQLLGKPDATITDLAAYLRERATGDTGQVSDADLIISYFQQGFGVAAPETRTEATTLRFEPDEKAGGIRWDNRLNWNTEDLPGAANGDSVDLGGNWVEYGGTTLLSSLEMGSSGRLNITHGKLSTDTLSVGDAGGQINLDKAGQFWVDKYEDTDALDVNVDGGRFANTGEMSGTFDITATDGQVLLATDGAMTVNSDSRLAIHGDDAKVGFDGENGDTAVLDLKGGTLAFKADADGLGTISEISSGHFVSSDVQSGAHLGGALEIDVTAISGQAGSHVLMKVDELVGQFESIKIIGQAADQNAVLTIDYETDSVVLELQTAGEGSGKLSLQTAGEQTDAQQAADLWQALTENHPVLSETPEEDVEIEVDVIPA